MAVTPIFSYTPQNATLIAGMLVGYSTASADPDSNSGTWSPWNGITEIGDIGNSGAFVEQTTLAVHLLNRLHLLILQNATWLV